MISSGFRRAKSSALYRQIRNRRAAIPNHACGCSIKRLLATRSARQVSRSGQETAGGSARTYIYVAALIDTNILVYRFDNRFPGKQRIATEILRQGIVDDSVRVPHQAIVEFIAAVTRRLRGHVILKHADALREAEELLNQFTVLYPNEAILRLAIRGCAAYQLNWFDAHLWSYAEHFGLDQILTEDLQHDRMYGSVCAINPFAAIRG